MLRPAINSNITIRAIENFLLKYDIRMSDRSKAVLAVLIPGLIFRDGKIIIMSVTINQINKIIKRKRDDADFVSLLLGLDIITDIDIYGTITIPLAYMLSKVTIKKSILASP